MGIRSSRGRVNALTPPLAAIVAAVACAAATAWWLRTASTRPEAAWTVPVLLLWGLIACSPAWSRREITLSAVVAAAVAVRLVLIGAPPLFSDDVYRYLFEGRALALGHNPFLTPPAALEGVDDALRAQVNHPEYTSIYPPVALAWFRVLAIGGTVTWAQALTAAVDVTTCAFLARALSRAGRPLWPALVYALHPVPAVESAVGAHIDVLAVALATAALAATGPVATGLAALGAGTKLLPIALLPATVRTGKPMHHLAALGLSAAVMALLAWPVLAAGEGLFASLGTYTAHWRFNALALSVIEPGLGDLSRPTLIAMGIGFSGWAAWRFRDPAALWLAVGTAFLVLSPTVHPWYALWALVPSLALARWGWALASTALLASYAILATLDPSTGQWQEGAWVGLISWGPALLALVAEAVTRRRAPP